MLYRPTPAITGFSPGFGPELVADANGLFDFAPKPEILQAFATHGIQLAEVGASPSVPTAAELELVQLRQQLAEAQAAAAAATAAANAAAANAPAAKPVAKPTKEATTTNANPPPAA